MKKIQTIDIYLRKKKTMDDNDDSCPINSSRTQVQAPAQFELLLSHILVHKKS